MSVGEIIDYMNPFSNRYHACEHFKELSGKQQFIAIALTTLATIFSLGLGTVATFRSLVGRFKEIPKEHSSETQTAHDVAQKILSPEVSPRPERDLFQITSSLKTAEKSEHSIDDTDDDSGHSMQDVEQSDDEELSYGYEEFDDDLNSVELGHYSDDDDEYLDDSKSEIEKTPLEEIATRPVKHVSTCTRLCREKLTHMLEDRNQKIVETPDDGDCFYGAFAAGISHHIGKEVSLQEIRQIVSNELKKLDAENPDNWVKKAFENRHGEIDTYESYLNYIHEDTATSLKNGRYPIWGKEAIDGLLLCQYYKVNLSVLEMVPMTDFPEALEDIADGDSDYPSNETKRFEATIHMAIYPGHFLGVIPAKA